MTFLRLCTKQTCFPHICRATFVDQCNLLMNWLVNWQKINRKQIWFIPSVIYQAKMTNIHWFHHCFVNVHWIPLHSGLVVGQNILFLPFFDNQLGSQIPWETFFPFFPDCSQRRLGTEDWGLSSNFVVNSVQTLFYNTIFIDRYILYTWNVFCFVMWFYAYL